MKHFLIILCNPYVVLVWFLLLSMFYQMFSWSWIGGSIFTVVYYGFFWLAAEDMLR